MSKEMTPKEAIQMIQDNLTPRTLGILTVEFNVVKKALDRLEQLEIADRNNQNLVKTNVELVNKNLELQKENEWLNEQATSFRRGNIGYSKKVIELEKENQDLKEKAKKYDELCLHNVMGNQSFGDDLIQGILALNKRVIEKNKKQVKVIAWLKNTFEITLDSKVRISDGTDCIQAFPIDLKTNEVIYDLLKEVLESV